MTDSDLMPIGTFARIVGLTASALRFYDDAGVLRPDHVDSQTGYRFYSEEQIDTAQRLRELRELGMPLSDVSRFFAAETASDSAESLRLLNDHMRRVSDETARLQLVAARLSEFLQSEASTSLCTLSGPVFAAAVDQLLATTADDPDFPVLNGVRLCVEPDALILAATDRYRFTSRTLVPSRSAGTTWAGTVSGHALRNTVSAIRRSPTVTLEAGDGFLRIVHEDGTVCQCTLIEEPFPDARDFFSSLPTAVHHYMIDRRQLLQTMEQQAPDKVSLRLSASGVQVLHPADSVDIDGTGDSSELTLWFELTTLHPAVTNALGNDLILDVTASDQPVILRSADDGDFTTVLMPCQAPAH
ncbi:MerR family transcriptional regulator [Brevibacterium sp. K11IcPPYGO002]|uniref:DNA polymerase III subunit beta family protein n=1 Tax=Brevibacterium sp. K11IcPPYGO002 TaxID=3058837 RepID=UPI003D81486E